MKKAVLSVLTLLTLLTLVWWWQRPAASTGSVESLLGMLADENSAGFSLAEAPGAIQFPRDFGPHYNYQTEWWYYTGNVDADDGRRFGYQLTFFRRALAPPGELVAKADGSSWRASQVYMAHFAISDVANGVFYPAEKFSRGALGLAGAMAQPYGVWLDDWRAQEGAGNSVQLVAHARNTALDLRLTKSLPPILQGDAGLSVKNSKPGNASYYYSVVQQKTVGTVTIDGHEFAVSGLSWEDHEYMTSALSGDDVGWDWFGLQFDNGAALMICQIRRKDGHASRFSSGSFIGSDGKVTHLELGDWRIEPADRWTSDYSGASYPTSWEIEIQRIGVRLTAAALVPNSEWRRATTYWEGPVALDGSYRQMPIKGRGYVEMTGYLQPVS